MSRRIIIEHDAEPAYENAKHCDRLRVYCNGETIVAIEYPAGHRWTGALTDGDRETIAEMCREWLDDPMAADWPEEWFQFEVDALFARAEVA